MFFPFFKKKSNIFSKAQQEAIVAAIRNTERQTSGEVRVYVETNNPFMDPLDRAKEIFFQMKMQETENRNAVLIYIAHKDRELAIFADQGIYDRAGADFWNHAVKGMLQQFSSNNIVDGLINCIGAVGESLRTHFPYDSDTDKNELPDDIIFGK